ncbi:MAG: sulfatase-like hydrolase/transferase [Candidatus Eremiobacteraeota bacterium]|nr:sulfatase-like hydrolase/transferase [Candidatus Eremiobacteraeota bacterium]
MKRREFLQSAASVVGALAAGCASSDSAPLSGGSAGARRPNILMIVLDEFRVPPAGYGANEGEAAGLKEIFGFARQLSPDNPYARFFPGLLRLRRNAVVMRNHYLASAACVPSRTALLTGQYSSLTGVTTTYGLFTTPDEVRLLDPAGVPTVGDWFNAAGYTSHFFGLFDVASVPAPFDLSPWGFTCWETSGPNPHGGSTQDFGVFRDVGFAEAACDFLSGKGGCSSQEPWFAVTSLVNPHDVTAYPFPFYGNAAPPPQPAGQPQTIPPQGAVTNADPVYGVVPLNPDGFPQDTFGAPPTLHEDLSTKPSCQQEFAYKIQLAFGAQLPDAVRANTGYPWQLQGPLAEPWVLAYAQFYMWLHYVVDQQLSKILSALDASGQAENTIVVFCADHGDVAGAHGQMIQKWHSAYQEAIHVPFVVSSPLVNPEGPMREVFHPTSHIDMLPTLLGLAGLGGQLGVVASRIQGHSPLALPVGVDLSDLIRGNGSAPARPGVLFTTDDEITGPGVKQAQYEVFLSEVERVRSAGVALSSGSVRQPNHVRCLCTGEWKLARYFDPSGVQADEYELYCLRLDPNEAVNLVDYRTFAVRTSLPGLSVQEIERQRDVLRSQLAEQERALLLTP